MKFASVARILQPDHSRWSSTTAVQMYSTTPGMDPRSTVWSGWPRQGKRVSCSGSESGVLAACPAIQRRSALCDVQSLTLRYRVPLIQVDSVLQASQSSSNTLNASFRLPLLAGQSLGPGCDRVGVQFQKLGSSPNSYRRKIPQLDFTKRQCSHVGVDFPCDSFGAACEQILVFDASTCLLRHAV